MPTPAIPFPLPSDERIHILGQTSARIQHVAPLLGSHENTRGASRPGSTPRPDRMETSYPALALVPDDCAPALDPGSPLSTRAPRDERGYSRGGPAPSATLSAAGVEDCTTAGSVRGADARLQTHQAEITAYRDPGALQPRARTSGFVVLAQETPVRPHARPVAHRGGGGNCAIPIAPQSVAVNRLQFCTGHESG